ncbi:hypothetical protein AALP_AA7G086000 [Arabis alpina]|uniref:Uncharacterized protein n=1 Tax=Arabis alpina TaxID=50452 RepID=A0A087GGS6_ARAAL|nr:hypothetical protein AALP_AA7G086000 [Arabis alpina]
MNTFRFGTLIRRTSSHQFLNYAKSFAGFPKSGFFSGCTDGESEVYHHARLFRKPLSAQFKFNQSNSISLMGFVDRPVRVLDTNPDNFGVFTFLRVKDPRDPNRSFRMSLGMWDGIARMCIAHLKQNDFIHVSGRLVSYSKNSENEDRGFDFGYQVKVTEVNYAVAPPSHILESPVSEKATSETVREDGIEEAKDDKIYLWQVFFANPYDWWDNRRDKMNSRKPDFKHKYTGEALWLDSDKPDWVTRQLELLDQRTAEKNCYAEKTRRGRLSDWI